MTTDRRFVVLWFSHWLTDVFRPFEVRPTCIIEERSMGAYVLAANMAAQRLGVCSEQRLTEARALIPDLGTYFLDDHVQARHQQKIARWANRFTPWVGRDHAADGLILDITGCAHLFGGERALLDHMLRHLKRHAITARAACAGSIGAAWALAHYAQETPVILPCGQEAEALMPLAVAALRLSAPTRQLCHQFGLTRIADLARQPRSSLVQRLGIDVIERLDQAFGARAESVVPMRPAMRFFATYCPSAAMTTRDEITHILPRLVDDVVDQLRRAGRGARRIEMRLTRNDRAIMSVAVALSQPVQLSSHIIRVLLERLERVHIRLDHDVSIDQMDILAPQTDPVSGQQSALFHSIAPRQTQALAHLCDRLIARLGRSPARPVLQGRYMPEKAVRFIPLHQERRSVPASAHSRTARADRTVAAIQDDKAHYIQQGWLGARPIILLPHAEPIDVISEIPEGAPRRFRWRRRLYEVAMVTGPERLSPEWWIDRGADPSSRDNQNDYGSGHQSQSRGPLTRDYFRLEDANGYRFWLYRDGLSGHEVRLARWYMHGFFA